MDAERTASPRGESSHSPRDAALGCAVDTLREALAPAVLLVQALPIDDTCVTLEPAQLVPAVHVLIHQCGLYHLSAITADDTGDGISLLYHFWDGHGLTLRTVLPAEQPVIATLTDLIPGASFYEREAAEMLGVTFEGAAPAGPLLLPDDWDGPPPLLRSAPEQEAAP